MADTPGATDRASSVNPWVRAGILLVSLVALGLISWHFTGDVIPRGDVEGLLVVGTLLFVVLSTLVLERYFTGPGDAFVNALSALVAIFPLRDAEPAVAWWLLFAYLALTAAVALVALLLQRSQRGQALAGALARLQRVCFQISAVIGKARVVYSVVFIVVIAFFATAGSPLSLALLVFWGVQIGIWSFELPQLLSRLHRGAGRQSSLLGAVERIDSPYLVRLSLADRSLWGEAPERPILVHLSDGSTRWAVRVASEHQADGEWGTAILGVTAPAPDRKVLAGIAELSQDGAPSIDEVLREIRPDGAGRLVGLVREGTTPSRLRVELLPGAGVTIGAVLSSVTETGTVFYQLLDAETSEEPFGTLRYGSHIAVAPSIGALDVHGRLDRVDWVPAIGAAVFKGAGPASQPDVARSDFTLGTIPGTQMTLTGDFVGQLESHTAILGTTGSGKTEFAFDLLRHAAANDVKVVCIDLTSQYAPRLGDLGPTQLTISDALAKELGDKLFEAETGSYGAGAEKKALKEFADKVRAEVEKALADFLSGADQKLAIVELREIANTKATLWITEMYLSTLLKLAKDKSLANKVLVVVEEAHTVMPEASFVGLGDFDSKGTVAKITQLALQGRKYGVGLLVLAQRTATVSKSVLTQCNTVISFSCIDDTSIGFLRNVYGSAIAEGLPNLRRLRAIAHGPWINSGLPVVFDVPFDEEKAKRKTWGDHRVSSAATSATPVVAVPTARVEKGEVEDAPF